MAFVLTGSSGLGIPHQRPVQMATAGCGDVLTGLIAGMLAQGLEAVDAAVAGVYLHGLAGDLVAMDKGEWGLLAGDIVESIPAAILSTARASVKEHCRHAEDHVTP